MMGLFCEYKVVAATLRLLLSVHAIVHAILLENETFQREERRRLES
jgi:hypothetical protein